MKFTALVLSRIAEGSKFVNNYCECTLQGPDNIWQYGQFETNKMSKINQQVKKKKRMKLSHTEASTRGFLVSLYAYYMAMIKQSQIIKQ